jgi:GntR family transcriptional regulator / MocR family aminotransferase
MSSTGPASLPEMTFSVGQEWGDTAWMFNTGFGKRMKTEHEPPIYQQIYDNLRNAILVGQIKKGTRLPSTRSLAIELGVSRNTVLNAYDQLAAEGYLEQVAGTGTFVTQFLPEDFIESESMSEETKLGTRTHRFSERSIALASLHGNLREVFPPARGRIAFTLGEPALDAFPFDVWARLVNRHANGIHPEALVYPEPAGYRPLREAIADYVTVTRQVRCTAEQVIITNGSQGAVSLAAQVLLNPGEDVWFEDPGYINTRRALTSAGAHLIPVPVDAESIQVGAGIGRAPCARIAYVTPSHQFPLGMMLSLQRRFELLEWARQAHAYILEDDYDGEYRFAGRPLAPLYGLDNQESVISLGPSARCCFRRCAWAT